MSEHKPRNLLTMHHAYRISLFLFVLSTGWRPLFAQRSTAQRAASTLSIPPASKPVMQSLTVGIPSFFDGFTALTYERRVNPRFSVAIGAGVTYNSFLMQIRDQRQRDDAYTGGVVYTGPNTFDIEEEFENRFYHEALPGIYLALTPKVYFDRRALDGFYVAPMFEWRDYRFRTYKGNESEFYAPYLTATTERGVQRVHEEVAESVRAFDVSAILGGHHRMRGSLVIGYHLGIGLRNSVARRQDFGLERVQVERYRFTNAVAETSDTRWIANFGFAVGGFW